MTIEQQDISNNKLRAMSAVVLLILALVNIILKNSDTTINIILISLASFFVGGAILSNINKPNIE